MDSYLWRYTLNDKWCRKPKRNVRDSHPVMSLHHSSILLGRRFRFRILNDLLCLVTDDPPVKQAKNFKQNITNSNAESFLFVMYFYSVFINSFGQFFLGGSYPAVQFDNHRLTRGRVNLIKLAAPIRYSVQSSKWKQQHAEVNALNQFLLPCLTGLRLTFQKPELH